MKMSTVVKTMSKRPQPSALFFHKRTGTVLVGTQCGLNVNSHKLPFRRETGYKTGTFPYRNTCNQVSLRTTAIKTQDNKRVTKQHWREKVNCHDRHDYPNLHDSMTPSFSWNKCFTNFTASQKSFKEASWTGESPPMQFAQVSITSLASVMYFRYVLMHVARAQW